MCLWQSIGDARRRVSRHCLVERQLLFDQREVKTRELAIGKADGDCVGGDFTSPLFPRGRCVVPHR